MTIEKDLREKLGIKPKDTAIQWIEDGRLVMIFFPHVEPHMRSLAGILGPPPRLPDPNKSWDEMVAEAAAAEYEAKVRPPSSRGEEDE